MDEQYTDSGKLSDLRKRAQQFLEKDGQKRSDVNAEDVRSLVHELETHQIELELQNEDLRQAQEALTKSHNRISDLYDFAPVGYLTINSKGMIVECNLTAANMIGLERSVIIKQPLSTYIANEDQDILYLNRKKILSSGDRVSFELRMKNSQKGLFYTNLSGVSCSELEGKSDQYVICFEDINEKKILQKTIEKSKIEWEKSFDSISDPVFLIDSSLKVIRANTATSLLVKTPLEKLLEKKCYDIFCDKNKPCLDCPAINTLKDGVSRTSIITCSKLNKFLQTTSSAISIGGKIDKIICVIKDITEQKKLDEKMSHENKMNAIGNLAGGIAHDFNNILSIIIGHAELAKRKIPINHPVNKDLSNILSSSQRATKLIQQILSFCSKHSQVNQRINLSVNIQETLGLLKSTIPSTINIITDICPDCGEVYADPVGIEQIILNLCTNSLYAMHDQSGTLTIKLERKTIESEVTGSSFGAQPGAYICLSIADTGCGMDEETIARVFEPFFTTKEFGRGSGMGLAVVFGIVQMLNGFISVDSTTGAGSTFSVYLPELPSVPEKHPAIEDTEPNHDTSRFTGNEKILFVDDEPLLGKVFKKKLELYGYSVTAMTDSEHALDKILENPKHFDLLITDQTMPKLSGFQLSKAVLEVNPSMPIILCTGHSAIITKKEALEAGIKCFLSKPVIGDQLLENIRIVLNENRDSQPA